MQALSVVFEIILQLAHSQPACLTVQEQCLLNKVLQLQSLQQTVAFKWIHH